MLHDTLSQRLWEGTYTDKDVDDARGAFFRTEIDAGTLSSILYSAAGKKRAEGDKDEYARLMQEAAAASDAHAIIHAETFSADDWDVRQAIMQESGRLEEAEEALEKGFAAISDSASAHVRALLHLGKADLALKRDQIESARDSIRSVEAALLDAGIDRRQMIRLYRGLVRFYKRTGDMEKMAEARSEAEHLIEETGALDQRGKLAFDQSS